MILTALLKHGCVNPIYNERNSHIAPVVFHLFAASFSSHIHAIKNSAKVLFFLPILFLGKNTSTFPDIMQVRFKHSKDACEVNCSKQSEESLSERP